MVFQDRPRFEVADIVRAHGDDYRRAHHPSAAQASALSHIAQCRTAALGGHLDQCDACGHQRISYNSCRDRHCPKCQSTARAQWVSERLERLLPVPYFHVVFTIPSELNPVALRNQKLVFDILFAAASKTLLAIAADPQHLGAQIGATSVLHTWGQNLEFHPHLHCVVTGGGLSPDGARWIPAPQSYLLPVKVLGALFRGKFLHALDQAFKDGTLDLRGTCAELADPGSWRRLKDGLYGKDWVVYAKPPFGGATHVFAYLGNYTHRIAISNHRIVELADGKVTFSWKDYAHGCRRRLMTLDGVEFLRRFVLHVLPHRFVRIRHYGLCASRNVNGSLVRARGLLEPAPHATPVIAHPTATEPPSWSERFLLQTGIDVMACPSCSGGRMVRGRALSPLEAAELAATLSAPNIDTS